ncbi:uncharacterized protein LOC124912474 [Impatiens glandulifera]|uniref:uncharacterized protein LOC124912474 n=1 Tax=Impatiens glandulifera TaxID=253017 RepID=UPI001FB06877|nr:uncharacterized protein LOC124912474 [Impatiens glandulifera]
MLWSEGVRTFDVCRGQQFNLKAMLLWIINDFSAYGMLSGWSTHCIHEWPICMKSSNSFHLKFSKKPCYFDSHIQFLAQDHPYRVDTDHFLHGKTAINQMPSRPTGVELWNVVSGMKFAFKDPDGYPPSYGVSHKWTKKSIFWELPYWGSFLIRHNIDFMHVEKNVFENIINIVMNVKGRKNDNINAKKDIFLLCNRLELHIDPQSGMNRSKVVYTLTRDDNKILCEWLKGLKFLDGYTSNLSRCVDRSGCKLIGRKSHDCHVFLERLLPIAFKKFLPNFVWATLTDLSNFMHDLSSTTLSKTSMDNLELAAPVILCNLAKIFPPAFFDSMEHLLVHLTYEANVGGPIQYRWMYPFERTFCQLKEGLQVASIDREFATWFRCQILEENEHNTTRDSSDLLYYVSYGPLIPATSIPIYFVNEYVWRPTYYESNRSSMNSGVCVKANDAKYYERLEEIIQLQYPGPYMGVVLFKCMWFNPTKGTRMNVNYRLVEVNMKRKYLRYDPFILSQQAIQVYYSPYPSGTSRQSSWMFVYKTKARGKVED